jgi:hypothetical protein
MDECFDEVHIIHIETLQQLAGECTVGAPFRCCTNLLPRRPAGMDIESSPLAGKAALVFATDRLFRRLFSLPKTSCNQSYQITS